MMDRVLRIGIDRRDHLLLARHPAYETIWDLDRGGTLVYLRDRRSQVDLLDARAGGPAPGVVISASATLEEKEHWATSRGGDSLFMEKRLIARAIGSPRLEPS